MRLHEDEGVKDEDEGAKRGERNRMAGEVDHLAGLGKSCLPLPDNLLHRMNLSDFA